MAKTNMLFGMDEDFETQDREDPIGISRGMSLLDLLGGVSSNLGLGKAVKESSGSLMEAISDLGKDLFPSKGSIDFKNKPQNQEEVKKKQTANMQRQFYSDFERSRLVYEAEKRDTQASETARILETVMSSDQKLEKLHLSTSLDEKMINTPYHIMELRRKIKEEVEQSQKAKKTQEVKKAAGPEHLLDTMAEGNKMSTTGGAGVG